MYKSFEVFENCLLIEAIILGIPTPTRKPIITDKKIAIGIDETISRMVTLVPMITVLSFLK